MTGRAAATQGGLAAVGLLAALVTSQRQPEHAPGSVTVIDATKMDVTHVHYTDEHNAVDFERGHGDKDAPVWIHLVPTAEAPKPDKKMKGETERQAPGADAPCPAARSGGRRARRPRCSTSSRRWSRRGRSASSTRPSSKSWGSRRRPASWT